MSQVNTQSIVQRTPVISNDTQYINVEEIRNVTTQAIENVGGKRKREDDQPKERHRTLRAIIVDSDSEDVIEPNSKNDSNFDTESDTESDKEFDELNNYLLLIQLGFLEPSKKQRKRIIELQQKYYFQ